jgi:hypothetical protein
MTINEARMICELRLRQYTLRALAEVFYRPNHPMHGNQGEGEELLREATEILGRGPGMHYDDFIHQLWDRTV